MKIPTITLSTDVGKMIKTLRLKQNWKQKDIAERLDISIASFSKIEAGLTVVSMSRLQQIADLYDVALDYLLAGGHKIEHQKSKNTLDLLKEELVEKENEIRHLQARAISLYDELNKKKKANKAKSA
jgi:transcriptional regulator with XRE-family HTH domain